MNAADAVRIAKECPPPVKKKVRADTVIALIICSVVIGLVGNALIPSLSQYNGEYNCGANYTGPTSTCSPDVPLSVFWPVFYILIGTSIVLAVIYAVLPRPDFPEVKENGR